jgi:L-fucose isomerase-like protein
MWPFCLWTILWKTLKLWAGLDAAKRSLLFCANLEARGVEACMDQTVSAHEVSEGSKDSLRTWARGCLCVKSVETLASL